ncbi:hypothetical protein HAX54_017472, partial [Datura stramonium]|nr:hypothetical protein [Datura stramonium]
WPSRPQSGETHYGPRDLNLMELNTSLAASVNGTLCGPRSRNKWNSKWPPRPQ